MSNAMKILVCVKQVPDAEAPLCMDSRGDWITAPGDMVLRMNRFDAFALEEAVRIREHFQDTGAVVIHSVSVGPRRVRETLKKSLALGVEEAFHILLEGEGYVSAFDTAALIASFADGDYDLILAGVMAEDDMQGLVGSLVAECLGYPCATAVMRQRMREDFRGIHVHREIEAGRRELIEMKLPAVLTVQSGINRPRYPRLTDVLRARKQEPVTIAAGRLAKPAARERLVSLSRPPRPSRGVFLQGSPREKARALLQALHEESFL